MNEVVTPCLNGHGWAVLDSFPRSVSEAEEIVQFAHVLNCNLIVLHFDIADPKVDAKTAIKTYEELIELFGNLAQQIQKIVNMDALDYIMKKVFMNFFVEGKKVVNITQNSPFRELCESPFGVGSP